MKTVWFIRHGLSEANAGLPTTDPGLIALTPAGHGQAKILADTIGVQPDLVVCSSYIRTQETARPLLEKYPQVKTVVWPLHEFDFLAPETCLNTTMEQRRPMVKKYWDSCQPDYVHGPGAESFNNFRNRVIQCIQRLEERDENLMMVFAHGHVMRLIWQYFSRPEPESELHEMLYFRDRMTLLPVPNTAVFKAEHSGSAWKILEPAFDPEAL